MADYSHAVRWIIGLLFIVGGILKLFPLLEEMDTHILNAFTELAAVSPTVLFGVYPDPKFYITFLSVVEILCANGLLYWSPIIQKISSVGLMVIMAGAIQSFICVGKSTLAVFPAILFMLLLYIWKSSNKKCNAKKVK